MILKAEEEILRRKKSPFNISICNDGKKLIKMVTTTNNMKKNMKQSIEDPSSPTQEVLSNNMYFPFRVQFLVLQEEEDLQCSHNLVL